MLHDSHRSSRVTGGEYLPSPLVALPTRDKLPFLHAYRYTCIATFPLNRSEI
jgi:hypothetical protein